MLRSYRAGCWLEFWCKTLWSSGIRKTPDGRSSNCQTDSGVEMTPNGSVLLQSWLPARALVQEALEQRHKVDPSGQIIKLPVAGCPWKEHLAQLEEEQKLGDAIKFCLYEVCGHWLIDCTTLLANSNTHRSLWKHHSLALMSYVRRQIVSCCWNAWLCLLLAAHGKSIWLSS